jgi:hypothetical protein
VIPADLAQLRHIELVERALEITDQRGSSPDRGLGQMSRDQLIAFILNEREQRDRQFRRRALEFVNGNYQSYSQRTVVLGR